jgi:FkbM family methyltransferase
MKRLIKQILQKNGITISRAPIQASTAEIDPVSQRGGKYFVCKENGLNYFETPIGNYFLPSNAPNDIVINTMRRGEYFEKPIIDIAERYIKRGTAAIDVGANFGQMAIHFSKLAGENGKVYAFDADDYVFQVFQKNIAANKASNVVSVFGAVYSCEGRVFRFPKQDFVEFGAYGSYGLDPTADSGRNVTSITVDGLGIQEPISFMKVDVQGSDLFAMQGARQTIARHRMPIIFEFEQQFQERFGTSFQDYVDFVKEIDYVFAEVVSEINYLLLPKEWPARKI